LETFTIAVIAIIVQLLTVRDRGYCSVSVCSLVYWKRYKAAQTRIS